MVKAIFFDIDGTLVPFGYPNIPQSTCDALNELKNRGIKIFISTGRHAEWITNLNGVDFDGYVTVNGAMCLLSDKKECIYKHSVDQEDIARLIPFINKHNIPFVIVPAEGGLFITSVNDIVNKTAQQLHIPNIPVRPIEDALGMDVVQMMGFFNQEEQDNSGIFDGTLLKCVPTRWCPYFTDIIPIGSNKSVGIDRIIDHFGIDLSETMAFGDGGNDIGMIKHAGIGVAMGNAEDGVKDVADYVTSHIKEDGLINALRHFNLL